MIAARVHFEVPLVYVFTACLTAESSIGAIARKEIVFGRTGAMQAGIFSHATVFEIAELACQAFRAEAIEFVLVFATEI